jgi:hypothetical protein
MKIELINTHRVKWLYDKCTTIDEMLERLSAEIEYLEDIQELGAKLEGKSEDDYTRIIAKVEEGSEEHKQLVDNMGFEVEDLEDQE